MDTQVCSEGGENLGWIESGEWVEYTVNVLTAGTYDMDIRTASQDAGGNFYVSVQGRTAASGSFNATGDWQNWTTVHLEGIELNAGTQVIRISMDSSNFNINWFEFAEVEDETTPPGDGNSDPDDGSGDDPVSNDPFTRIQAENYIDSSNITVISGDNGEVIQFQDSNSWIAFELDFDQEPVEGEIRARDTRWGSNISFKLDSPDGQTFCTVYPDGGSEWHLKSNSTWPRPTGNHTVYVVANTSTVELNWFSFSK